MNYLKAVLKKDETTKINELKKLILLGKKLKKNTRPDEKKLEILIGRQNKKSSIKKIVKTKATTSSTSNIKYSISSVYTSKNTVIVNFNKDITKEFIKFFELKQKPLHKDVYDIQGYFKDAAPTKLSIDGVDKITIGQNKPNVLRIVLSNKTNLKTSIKVEKRKLIIKIDSLNKKYKTIEKKIIKKSIPKKIIEKQKYIDKKNSIRTLYTDENKIVIKFNKDFSKKLLKYSAYKSNKLYNDVFDIKGKYKYTKPIKLQIDGLDRIIVSQKDDKTLRVRIQNKKDIKVYYYIKKRELIIKVVGLSKKTISNKSTLPYLNFKSKTIVIDAGHGAKDVGAVGPKKRYEKVVTLKVAKYLYSILKQRGHKVYLTRNNDRFIKVSRRTVLANKKNADIFISIHANSVPKSKAHKISGIETFFLSPARSARAKRVAAKENKSDIRKMSNSSKNVLLESLNRPRITASHKLAIDTQAGMLQSVKKSYSGVKDSGVREGPFWVLVGAQMPSILIELGYMSHPLESKRLYSSKYQKLLANGIANGVDSYFSKNP